MAPAPAQKALFLDRDGVLNIDTGYLFRKEEWQWREGAVELCTGAARKGYLLVVITNQSGIARGKYDHSDVASLHAWVQDQLRQAGAPLTDIWYCPHHPEWSGRCLCRKPGSLMLERAAALHGIDLSASWMIGDHRRDLEAGRAAGCKTAFVGNAPMEIADFILQKPSDLLPHL